jgi:hypothetical protein
LKIILVKAFNNFTKKLKNYKNIITFSLELYILEFYDSEDEDILNNFNNFKIEMK